jgi:hypothetical protein
MGIFGKISNGWFLIKISLFLPIFFHPFHASVNLWFDSVPVA